MASWASPTEKNLSTTSRQKDASNSSLDLPNCHYYHRPVGDGHGEERHSIQRDDARFKAIWEKEMGDVGERSIYQSVSVLLISWDDEAGDLKTEEEVRKLRHIFERKYNFDVDDKRLDTTKPAQLQLNKHLANFVDDKHDECGLLIIYYAGHGIPGNMPGELTLAGSRNPAHHDSDRKKRLNEIIWHRAENLIKDSWGDVLIIFDCCAAGNLGRDIGVRGHWASRTFEFLGATSAEETTPEPGPSSFTSGLIWALEQLASEDGFTASQLLRRITQAPNFPPQQYPVHHDRDKPSLKKIVISPLLGDERGQIEAAAKNSSAPAERLEFLDLRMLMSYHPTDEDITDIARALKDMLRTKSMSAARHIAWGKLSAIEGSTGRFPNLARSLSYLQKWRNKTRTKSVNKNGLHANGNFNGHTSSKDPIVVTPPPPELGRKRRRQE